MIHIFLDLEFNQYFKFPNESIMYNKNCPLEILQIGAVKTNDKFEILGKFNTYVKPTIYKQLNPFVRKVTGISYKNLIGSLSFEKVYIKFIEFIGTDEYSLYTWGNCDVPILFSNAKYHHLDLSFIKRKFTDVQKYASLYLKNDNGQATGLKTCVEIFNLPSENEFHNALNDALYTLKVYEFIKVGYKSEKISLSNLC